MRTPTTWHAMRRTVLHLCITTAAASCTLTALPLMAAEKPAQPKLVVVLVVDGLPQEQVVRYRDQFGQGGLRRLLDQGAWFSDAHQAHGVTVTAVGHSAILTGAYPYQHGIIGNNWIDPKTLASVYCTEDRNNTYIGEETKPSDGTSPANLKVSTLGDELRYATGKQSKVITVSGKDRGAILLAGKTGTAYMYMDKTGNFASSTYYMQNHPQWVQSYQASKPQDRFYGKEWRPLLADYAYVNDVRDDLPSGTAASTGKQDRFPFPYYSENGKPDADYYNKLKTGPYLDELTLDFARAAIEGEQLGKNPAAVPDVLGVSLSSHDYVNHAYGPESKMSHDHLQRLDRLLANFFSYLDKRVGLDNTLVVFTADHGFPNVPEFSQANKFDAKRLDFKNNLTALNKQLAEQFGVEQLVSKWSAPSILLNYALIDKKNLKHEDVENAVARFAMNTDGIAHAFTRTQLENGNVPATRIGKLMQRSWHRQLSGDVVLVTKPYWYFGSGNSGTSHGSPYTYDTNVPLMLMGKSWIKPGNYPQYAEVMDIAPTLAHLLHVRPPSGSEGRILAETLR
ncbi:alkaline phosphatase family protein [Undibacterium sp. SXout7W]|uniref:alkaline phosphatase family protein n=1 Tax=Undibacterium sp. SXout7W TaxID=3413049 RepID=UPI003BF13D3B